MAKITTPKPLGISGLVEKVVGALLISDAARATKFISNKFIVRAVRKTYKGKFGNKNIELNITIGKPNYAEREFIKKCEKTGESFPVKKVQLSFLKQPKGKK